MPNRSNTLGRGGQSKHFFVFKSLQVERRTTINTTRDIISRLFDEILIGLDSWRPAGSGQRAAGGGLRAWCGMARALRTGRRRPTILIITAHIVVLIGQPEPEVLNVYKVRGPAICHCPNKPLRGQTITPFVCALLPSNKISTKRT